MRILVISPDTPGLAVETLISYLQEKSEQKFDWISHPVAPRPGRRVSNLRGRKIRREPHLSFLSYAGDGFLTFLGSFSTRKNYDLAICLSPHLAAVGLLLRRLGKVKKVVYWALDYYPTRYGSGGFVGRNAFGNLFERVYRRLEKKVVAGADIRWVVTPDMLEGWKEGGYVWEGPSKVVPHPTMGCRAPLAWAERQWAIIWSGKPGKDSGLDLLVAAWPQIATKVPDLTLTLTTRREFSPDEWASYKELLERSDVSYLGFIPDPRALRDLVRGHLIGLALYPPDSFKRYSDASRLKLYISQGTPVIVAGVPELGKQVQAFEAGLDVSYSVEGLVEAVLKLCQQVENEAYSLGAARLAESLSAERVFSENLSS